MANLLSASTSNGAGTGAAMSGPCTVYLRGPFAGARVAIQVADEDVSASYVSPFDNHFIGPCAVTVNVYGDYFIRAAQADSSSSTSITVVALQ